METLLTLGAISALSLGIYMVLSPANASAKSKVEQDNLEDLSRAVERSFGLLGGFESVSTLRVVDDNLAPKRMVDGDGLRTAWGTSASVSSESIRNPNDAFVITYPATPADVCSRLAAAVSRSTFDIRVDGTSVFRDGQLDPALTASQCGAGATSTMEFVYHSGLVGGTPVAAPVLILPTAPPSVSLPFSPPVGTPVAPVGPVGPASGVSPVSTAPVAPAPAVPLPSAPPAAPVAPTTPPAPVTPAPTAPPSTVAACSPPSPWTQTENRSANCAAGQAGTINERRTATHSYACPEAWDAPVETVSPWSAWTVSSSTCAACPAPSTQTATDWVGTSSACPSGQLGTITWEYARTRSRSVSYNCPAGTTSLPPATLGAWSAWSNTGATRNMVNGCSTVCVAPAPQSRWQVSTSPCPSGGTQSIEYREQRAASCPSPTGSYVWGSWTDTGDRRNYVGCAPTSCSGSPTYSETVAQNVACPAGQTGNIVQNRTITFNRSCVSGAWTGWDAGTWGSWITVSNTCTSGPSCSAPSPSSSAISRNLANENRTVACPSGQTGIHAQTRTVSQSGTRTTTWTCPGPTSSTSDAWGSYSYGTWTTTSNSCAPSATWQWVMTDQSLGGCGAQGGGGGGNICVSTQGDRNGYGCGGQVCNAAHDGVSYVSGYAERWDSPWPDCDYQVYTCMQQ